MKQYRACVLLRNTPSYRPASFAAGLARHGYLIDAKPQRQPRPHDLLLLWNRSRGMEGYARRYEQAGAKVLIAENGYLPDPKGGKLYALARQHHNGRGQWFVGPEPRMTFPLRDWRASGGHVLILPQRGIGPAGIAMPSLWGDRMRARLRAVTDREIRLRRHPGAARSDPWPDLRGAHCAVTWGSGAGIKSIGLGIPVFHELAGWIGEGAARFGIRNIEDCFTGDRGPMFHRLSWAMWRLDEIESGEAFEYLINAPHDSLSRAV
jgi:hypothetical protein